MNKIILQESTLNPDNYKNKPIYEKCCCFVINLERRPDRLKNFLRKYVHNDFIDLYLKKAVEGEKPNISVVKRLQTGEYGCFLSHYEIWKYIKTNSIPYCCVYEDDVNFSNDYNTKLHKLLKELPDDFNILYLGGRFNVNHKSKRVSKVTQNIVKHSYNVSDYKNRCWPGNDLDRTTHAYIISLKCATFLCKQICEQNPVVSMNKAVDHFLIEVLYKQNKMDIFNSQPLIAWSPRKGDSDIR
tara:strand:- start:528 stop:1253 length:726 start_codon:yes stop_codon:yes gene_type:complete